MVYGNEYYFGSGIHCDRVGATPYGKPLRVIELGFTHVPKDVFEIYLQEISPRYTAETYKLLSHNCNNFTNEVAQFLVGKTIPEYILNLPNEVMSSPMGALISKFLTPSCSNIFYLCSQFLLRMCFNMHPTCLWIFIWVVELIGELT